MRVLITGGAGFIGSHLVERLLSENHEVVCLDNLNDFYDPDLKRRNIESALRHSNFLLVIGDILDKTVLDKVFSTKFDMVVHLAAYAGVRPSIERPEIYQKVNIEGTLNLLECCRNNNIPKFVFASSSSVYGGRTEVPFRETDMISKPISPYAATKAAAEQICYTYHHLFGLNIHCLRFFTVYGPRQRPEMAINLFTRHMMRGDAFSCFGDGNSARDYTYIDDIIDGIQASVEKCKGFEILNLGGSKTTSLNQLVSILEDRLKVKANVEHEPIQPGDVPITFADVTRAKQVLGYEPKVSIERGIDLFCNWAEAERAKRKRARRESGFPSSIIDGDLDD